MRVRKDLMIQFRCLRLLYSKFVVLFILLTTKTPAINSKLAVDEARSIAYSHVRRLLTQAKNKMNGLEFIVLPEMFAQPYGVGFFSKFAEHIPKAGSKVFDASTSPTAHFLSNLASTERVWLVGGSISESSEGRVFNTSMVFDSEGTLVTAHRKLHLFDVDVPGGIRFKESETLTPGDKVTSFTTPWGEFGLGICYDVRFPEYAQVLRQRGCNLLLYPGAFNTTTGPKHWELLMRARANDCQAFVLACAPAAHQADPETGAPMGKEEGAYPGYGHSMIVDCWAEKLSEVASDEPGVAVAELDLKKVESLRQAIPVGVQKREDVYQPTKYLK